MSILQRCLVLSLAVHALLLLVFSGVVVTQQIVQYVRHATPLVPLVNLQLSREMEVRNETRRQFTALPTAEPAAIRSSEPMVHAPTPEIPLAIMPAGIPAARPDRMAIAVPQIAPALTVPEQSGVPTITITPVAPAIDQVVVTPLTELLHGDRPKQSGAAAGFANEQIAAANAAPLGAAPGPVAAPLASATAGTSDGNAGPANDSGIAGPYNAMPPTPQRSIPNTQNPVASPAPAAPAITIGPAESLPQRDYQQRQRLLHKYGGNEKTEAGVARGLAFLARTQEADGHWTRFVEPEKAGLGATTPHDAGLTGMAALAFLACDYSPNKPGIYQDNIRKAITYLRLLSKPDGDVRNGGNMYDQAIATIALAEAATLSHDDQTRAAALQAAQFIIAAQNSDGGWRYSPRDITSDTSVLGWQIMALRSAERIGLQIPDSVRSGAINNMAGKSGGRAGMLTGYLTGIPSSTMTAEAMFSRLALGMPLTDDQIEEAGGYLIGKLPSATHPNYYYWYYGSLALLQLSKTVPEAWTTWNSHAADALLALQFREGPLAGSLNSDGEWADRGGRVYSTALATLTLEVYYRYPVAETK
jgi:hypothetical protein